MNIRVCSNRVFFNLSSVIVGSNLLCRLTHHDEKRYSWKILKLPNMVSPVPRLHNPYFILSFFFRAGIGQEQPEKLCQDQQQPKKKHNNKQIRDQGQNTSLEAVQSINNFSQCFCNIFAVTFLLIRPAGSNILGRFYPAYCNKIILPRGL